jgi:hypothetical protein
MIAPAADARAAHEYGLARRDGSDQSRDELRRIAAIAVEKYDDACVLTEDRKPRLNGAPIAAPPFDDDQRACRGGTLRRSISGGSVYDNDFGDPLRQRGGGRTQGQPHRLHRSPQLAQVAGGRSDKSAARNAR